MRRLLLVLMVSLVACSQEARSPYDANTLYEGFFEAFTRKFKIDATNGNFVAHHGGDAAVSTLVLRSKTQVPGPVIKEWDHRSWDALKNGLPSLRRETCDDFWRRNAEPRTVTLTKAASWRVNLLSDAEYAEIKAEGAKDPFSFWKAFHRRFKRAQLTAISAPGISRDGSQMLIYLYSGFGPLAASASYYVLKNEDGAWQITDEWLLWVS